MSSQDIYGIRSVIECIESGGSIDKVWLKKGERKSPLYDELIRKLEHNKIPYKLSNPFIFEKIKDKNHQGVIAKIASVRYWSLEEYFETEYKESETPTTFLLLDNITDIRNVGAIIRSAVATGTSAIIVSNSGQAPLGADAVKTSAGSLFKIPIVRVSHLKDALLYLQGMDIETIALTEKASQSIYEAKLNRSIGIIMGSEDKGISKSILKFVNEKYKLPMNNDIDSLNVSVACGVMLYEILRQRIY